MGFCRIWLRELTGKLPVPLRFRLTPERFVKNRVKMHPLPVVRGGGEDLTVRRPKNDSGGAGVMIRFEPDRWLLGLAGGG